MIPVFLWNEEEEGRLAAGGATKVSTNKTLQKRTKTKLHTKSTKQRTPDHQCFKQVWLEEALKAFENTLAERYQSRYCKTIFNLKDKNPLFDHI